MENVYSVTEVNEGINKLFSSRPGLSNISIEGEVSNCTYNSSGHIYFTLKDSKSQISAVMFKGKRITGLKFALKDGMKVIVSGSIEVYVQGGKYQLYASRIEEAGLGILYEKYLKLKAILEEKGLFDEKNKKNIPRFIHDLYLYNYIIIYHVPVKRYANNKKHPSNHCILAK